ncbi:MAG: hypothetical protein ACRDT9_06440 [Agromyces sp.]
MSADGASSTTASSYERWVAHLAAVSAPVDLDAASRGRFTGPLAVPSDPGLPPLPPELASAVGRALQELRGRLAEIASERDQVAGELEQLARASRAPAERRPVYLDAIG